MNVVKNNQEQSENEQSWNLKLHDVPASDHSHHAHYYHSQYKTIQIHIWGAPLWIIYAVKNGQSPQTIYTDHKNHVRTIKKLNQRGLSAIKLSSPMLDIWRDIHRELRRRGGLQDTDDHDRLMVV